MGRHDVGKDGLSYSVLRAMEKDERDFRTRIIVIRRKCFRVAMHNGTHIASLIALHVIALTVLDIIPLGAH